MLNIFEPIKNLQSQTGASHSKSVVVALYRLDAIREIAFPHNQRQMTSAEIEIKKG
jgi:hypothetical protein